LYDFDKLENPLNWIGANFSSQEKNQEFSLQGMNRCDCVIEIWEDNE
jgi:hypothetical protein